MFSAVESMTNMVKEVELHEERSKHAKEAASSAAEDILSDAEELKKILIHAKEAKDMVLLLFALSDMLVLVICF